MSAAARGGRDRPPAPADTSGAIYWSKAHALAHERLGFAAKSRAPLTLFLGEPGAGRSLLIREMVGARRSGLAIGVIAGAQPLGADPETAVAAAFGAKRGAGLGDTLAGLAAAEEAPLLVIDDADRLPAETLVALLGLLTGAAGDLRLILVAAPEFAEAFQRGWPDLAGPVVRLTGMSEEDVAGYLRQRLDAAGAPPDLLAEDAVAEFVNLTGGLPGKINALCDASLARAAQTGSQAIDRRTVRQSVLASDIGKLTDSIARAPGAGQERLVLTKPLAGAPAPATRAARPDTATERPEPGLRLERAMEKIRTEARTRGKTAAGRPPPPAPEPARTPREATQTSPPRAAVPAAGEAEAGPSRETVTADAAKPAGPRRWRLPALIVLLSAAGAAAVIWSPPDGRLQDLVAAARDAAGLPARIPVKQASATDPAPASSVEAQDRAGASEPADAGTGAAQGADAGAAGPDPATRAAAPAETAPGAGGSTDPPAAAAITLPPQAAPRTDAEAAAARERVDRLQQVLAGYPETAEDRFRFALDKAGADPLAAVAAYAGAALLGHRRAAYYLGQIYETGDGVAVDRALAREWYRLAATEIAGAAALLDALAPVQVEGDLPPPLPLLATPAGAAQIDLVWTSAEGADPAGYRIELATDAGETVTTSAVQTLSALRMDLPGAARLWRVVALGADDKAAASSWLPLPAADE